MNISRLVAVAVAGLIAATAAVTDARAQSAQQQNMDRRQTMENQRLQNEMRSTDRRGRGPSPEQITRSAQAAATGAGLTCQVTASSLLGKTDNDEDLYEVACDGGSGYIIQASRTPRSFDCLLLAAQAEEIRARGAEVPVNSVCALPANQNGLPVLAAYAQEAGVPCQIDAGKFVGATPEGNLVYEVGCPNADGYHLEKTAQGWKATDCLEIIGMQMTCQFTTIEEQAQGFKPLLVGSAIDDCDAQGIRLLAQNDTGRFIEIKCGSGDGYVARVKANAIEQVYPCSAAQRIGGGCTLTRPTGE